MESDSTRRQAIDPEAKENDQITEESEDDVEIVEDENGQCTVRIKPKPIKLKIINPYATPNTSSANKTNNQSKKRKLSTEENINGHLNDSLEYDQSIPTAKKPRKDSKESVSTDSMESSPNKIASGRPKTPIQRDTRTHCDKVVRNT